MKRDGILSRFQFDGPQGLHAKSVPRCALHRPRKLQIVDIDLIPLAPDAAIADDQLVKSPGLRLGMEYGLVCIRLKASDIAAPGKFEGSAGRVEGASTTTFKCGPVRLAVSASRRIVCAREAIASVAKMPVHAIDDRARKMTSSLTSDRCCSSPPNP
jgi:hypothetical protein